MNWTHWFTFPRRATFGATSPTPVQRSLFGTGRPVGLPATGVPPKTMDGSEAAVMENRAPRPVPAPFPTSRSWWGILVGKNRRREVLPRWVQDEFRLRDIKPIRNELREDDVTLVKRRSARVIWETPVAEHPSDDQDLAWNRLRARRREHAVVHLGEES